MTRHAFYPFPDGFIIAECQWNELFPGSCRSSSWLNSDTVEMYLHVDSTVFLGWIKSAVHGRGLSVTHVYRVGKEGECLLSPSVVQKHIHNNCRRVRSCRLNKEHAVHAIPANPWLTLCSRDFTFIFNSSYSVRVCACTCVHVWVPAGFTFRCVNAPVDVVQ